MWLNEDQAIAFLKASEGLMLRQLLRMAHTAAVTGPLHGSAPSGHFDLCFFVQTLARVFQDPAFRAVVDGQDLRWWPEDDD
jgi:hypothetical protein